MQSRPNLVPAKQCDTEESRFQEGRRQDLIGQQGAGDAARECREIAPIGAELIGHYQPGQDAHGEVYGAYIRPELIKPAVGRVLAPQPKCLQHREIAGEPDRDRGNMMWNDTVNPNWARANSKAVKPNITAPSYRAGRTAAGPSGYSSKQPRCSGKTGDTSAYDNHAMAVARRGRSTAGACSARSRPLHGRWPAPAH